MICIDGASKRNAVFKRALGRSAKHRIMVIFCLVQLEAPVFSPFFSLLRCQHIPLALDLKCSLHPNSKLVHLKQKKKGAAHLPRTHSTDILHYHNYNFDSLLEKRLTDELTSVWRESDISLNICENCKGDVICSRQTSERDSVRTLGKVRVILVCTLNNCVHDPLRNECSSAKLKAFSAFGILHCKNVQVVYPN